MTPPISATHSGRGRPAPSRLAGVRLWACFGSCSRWKLRVAATVSALAIGAVLTATSAAMASRLTRNYTPSLPLGVYWLRPGLPVARGELVDFEIPEGARAFIVGRYLPDRFHLLKRVVALEGDDVCLDDGVYRVNAAQISTVAARDAVGRSLPPFRFCGRVPRGMAFVATPAPSSLDSRYFGPVPVSALTVARPLWTS